MVDAARPTTTKTRIWAGGVQQQVQQLLLRVDRVIRQPVDGAVLEALLRRLRGGVREVAAARGAVVMSDYENGVMHRGAVSEGIALAREAGAIVVADAHGDLLRFKGATALTPNQPEAEATLGRSITTPAKLNRAGADLLAGSEAEAVLMTRGREGMSLYTRDDAPLHLPAQRRAGVSDPTGAGDTVAAVFTLALVVGGTFREAAVLANLAAGAVVAKVGTATVSAGELLAIVERWGGTTEAVGGGMGGEVGPPMVPPSRRGDVDSCLRGNDGDGWWNDGAGADARGGVCVAGGGGAAGAAGGVDQWLLRLAARRSRAVVHRRPFVR